MKTISDNELAAVTSLPGPQRYEYFVKWVVDQECAWGLWDDGWALMADRGDAQALPLWPAKRYAEACRQGEFAQYSVREISLDELEKVAISCAAQQRQFAVFPTPPGKATVIKPEALVAELQRYADENYEA